MDIIENWITETPTIIDNQDVPAGSWLCTTKVTNADLIKNIKDGTLQSFSLGSLPEEAFTDKYWFINKSFKYKDFKVEDIKPLFISFVDKGANGYTFKVMTPNIYINKNYKNLGENMTKEEKVEVEPNMEEEKISISFEYYLE